MSVVPEGDGRNALELAEYTSEIRSIKGSYCSPCRRPSRLPSLTIAFVSTLESKLRLLYLSPFRDPSDRHLVLAGAYESDVLRPKKTQEIDLPFLQSETALCDPSLEADRCALLKAVFEHGELDVQHFRTRPAPIFGN